MKQCIKSLIYPITKWLPFDLLRKMAGTDLLVINYHSLMGWDPDEKINKNIYRTLAEFDADMKFLASNYKTITIEQIIDYKRHNIEIPKNSVYITFDDGLATNFQQKDYLLKYGLNASFFINPNFIDNKDFHYKRKANYLSKMITEEMVERNKEQYLSLLNQFNSTETNLQEVLSGMEFKNKELLNQLANLFELSFDAFLQQHPIYLTLAELKQLKQDGFDIGGHSMEHPDYRHLTIDEQIKQSIDSIQWVKDNIGSSSSTFAFPLNDKFITSEVVNEIGKKALVSFGVMGLRNDESPYHQHRITVEQTGQSIKNAIKLECIKLIALKLSGRATYIRKKTLTD